MSFRGGGGQTKRKKKTNDRYLVDENPETVSAAFGSGLPGKGLPGEHVGAAAVHETSEGPGQMACNG